MVKAANPKPAAAAKEGLLSNGFRGLVKRAVSRVEPTLQADGFLFTFLLAYFFLNIAIFFLAAVPAYRGEVVSQFVKFVSGGAKGFGGFINLNSALVIFLTARNLFKLLRQTPLNMFVPFDKIMPAFHMLAGNILMIGVAGHVICHLIRYSIQPDWQPGFTGRVSLFVSGWILTILMAVFRIMALKKVRSKRYEWFFRTHIIGTILYFILVLMHGNHQRRPSTIKWVGVPLAIYIIDYLSRWKSESKCDLVVARSCAMAVGPDVLCLKLPRVFPYAAGQYCDINVPSISKHEWHPFTIASAPHEPEMTFYIKAIGNWTRKLYIAFTDETSQTKDLEGQSAPDIAIHVRGPYGSPAQHVGQFSHIICIGGGVGVTPFSSVVKSAHYYMTNWSTTPIHQDGSAPAGPGSISRKQSMQSVRNVEHSGSRPHTPHRPSRSGLSGTPRSETSSFETRVASEASAPGDILPPISEDGPQSSSPNLALAMPPSPDTGEHSLARFYRDAEARKPSDSPDYIPDLGNPDAPIPTRGSSDPVTRHDVLRESESSSSLFSSMDSYVAPGPLSYDSDSDMAPGQPKMADRINLENMTSFEMEDVIRREKGRTSNLQGLMGLSFGSSALMRHIKRHDDVRRDVIRSSFVGMRTSMNYDSLEGKPLGTVMLFYLHSVTLNMLLLWSVLVRIIIAVITAIIVGLSIRGRGLGAFPNQGLHISDLVLGTVLVIPITLSIVLEIAEQGFSLFFASRGNLIDVFVLLPSAMATVVLDILAIAGIAENVRAVPEVTIFAIWPILFVSLFARVARIIGSRIALAQNLKASHSQTRSLDFIWTVPTQKDDTWLVQEVLPLANSGVVRLHRYITREDKKVEQWMLNYERIPLKTHYRRPNWDELFDGIAERSKSGTIIGIFFCGPHPMAKAIQQAAMRAMGKTIENGIRRGYKPALHDADATEGSGSQKLAQQGSSSGALNFVKSLGRTSSKKRSRNALRKNNPAAYGCNIKFSFREENFL